MTEAYATLEACQREIHRLSRLVEISLALNSTLELRKLLSLIMDLAAEITDSESASVLLYDRKLGQLRFVALTPDTPGSADLPGIPVPLDGSLAGAILLENRPIALDDVTTDPRHFQMADRQSGFATRALMGVPMRYQDQVIGVLESVNKRHGTWTPDDERNLMVLAAQSAVAIQNSRLVQQLQRAYNELDQLDKLKNDFIAIASHELRTPLSVILGYATFLKEDTEGAVGEHAAAVLNSALRMRNLIEDLTNLRYLKMGQAELLREHIPLAAIFQAAARDVENMAAAKGHILRVYPPDMSVIVNADRIKLEMAITNLLNNAIKFTPGGGEIVLTCERKPKSIWIMIKDTGIGIPQDQLTRIFEEFRQVEDHMTRRHGGMGLGLSIARAIVEAHNGRIWAESPGPQRGSTFTISLPLE